MVDLTTAWQQFLSNKSGWISSHRDKEFQSLLKISHLPEGINVIPYPIKWLEPRNENQSRLFFIAFQIFQVFKRNKWTIPKCDVRFKCYGDKISCFTANVDQIRGSHFILGFNGLQGVGSNLNDWSGFNFVVVPYLAMEFWNCGGPNIYKYTGMETNWRKVISEIDSVDCPLPVSYWTEVTGMDSSNYEVLAESYLMRLLTSWIRTEVLALRLLVELPLVLQHLIMDYGLPEI